MAAPINVPRLQRLLQRLSYDEEAAFRSIGGARQPEHAKDRLLKRAELIEALGGPEGISMGELPPGTDTAAVLSGMPLIARHLHVHVDLMAESRSPNCDHMLRQ